MEGEAAFELKDVQVGLGARAVLQQVNLSAPIGSVTGGQVHIVAVARRP